MTLFTRVGQVLNPNRDTSIGGAEARYRGASDSALLSLSLVVVAGVVLLYFGSAQDGSRTSTFAVSAVLAGASVMIGALLGFLFGIPRSLQGDAPEQPGRSGAGIADASDQRRNVGYRANTNLEQISDWLTKILVGVGLTQLHAIPTALRKLTAVISPALGGGKHATLLAGATIIYFLICGFLFAYLWTRLHLPSALRFADLDALGALEERLEENTRQLTELQKQAERDAHALSYVEQQLSADNDTALPAQDALNDAIAAASPSAKVNIFYRAQDWRRDNWKANKAKMERTIPIFRALIAADGEGQFHRNHAQLAYALKDKREPDCRGAYTELDEAIRIRDKVGQQGFGLYEANRAYCGVRLFDELVQEKGLESARAGILADIQSAQRSNLGRKMLAESEVQGWLARQTTPPDDGADPAG